MQLAHRDVAAICLGAAGLVCTGAAAWLLLSAVFLEPGVADADSSALASASALASPQASAVASGDVLVDVQGAVRRPGLVRLAPGARVADALQAAGGYSRQADLNAAATRLNLAAPLTDGAQVVVPMIGAVAPPASGGGTGGTGGGTLVNINTASPEELEALPGIGPVTVQKIVAARSEQPFATLDEMVEREVIDRGQLEDIRDLVTL